jgi:hypothetical protein
MQWHFALPGSSAPSCRLEKTFWLGQLRLWCQGREVPRSKEKGKPFLIRGSDGSQTRVHVKGNGWDYVPRLDVDGLRVLLDRPLSTLEYVVGGIPLLLMFLGGAIGGATGAIGAVYNYRVLRATASTPMKVLGLVGVTGLSFLTYLVVAALFQLLIRGGASG